MKDMNKEKSPVTKKGMCDPRIGALCIPQVCLGTTFSFLSFYVGYFHGEFILPSTSSSERVDLSSKLAYALRCSFPMLITLFAGIMIIAAKRALTNLAINPLSGNDGLILVDKLYLSNTLEQFVVGLTLMLIIASTPTVHNYSGCSQYSLQCLLSGECCFELVTVSMECTEPLV